MSEVKIEVTLKALPKERCFVLNNRSKKWEEGTVESADIYFPGYVSKDIKYHYASYRVRLDRTTKTGGSLFCSVSDEGISKIN